MSNHNSYRYFANKDCKYFPCHPNGDPDNFNCLFCYCPFYLLGKDCGGDYVYTKSGFKDCSHCIYPHKVENYEEIVERYGEIICAMPKQEEAV